MAAGNSCLSSNGSPPVLPFSSLDKLLPCEPLFQATVHGCKILVPSIGFHEEVDIRPAQYHAALHGPGRCQRSTGWARPDFKVGDIGEGPSDRG